MRLTKLGHGCVRLEKDGMTLVVDPGSFSADALDGAHAVLITHEHVDHVVADRLRAEIQQADHLRRLPTCRGWAGARAHQPLRAPSKAATEAAT